MVTPDVIRTDVVHGVHVLNKDGRPFVLAGVEVTDQEIAEQTRALLHRRQWAQLHWKLFGGLSPRALLTTVLAGAVAAVVIAAAVMGVIWVLEHGPGRSGPALIAPPAGAAEAELTSTAPGDGRSGQVPVKAGGVSVAPTTSAPGAPSADSGGGAGSGGWGAPSTGSIRGMVGDHPVRSVAGTQPVRGAVTTVTGAVSSVSSIVDDVEGTASSVLCTVLCPPN